MTQFENREFWFGKNIPLLTEGTNLLDHSKLSSTGRMIHQVCWYPLRGGECSLARFVTNLSFAVYSIPLEGRQT